MDLESVIVKIVTDAKYPITAAQIFNTAKEIAGNDSMLTKKKVNSILYANKGKTIKPLPDYTPPSWTIVNKE